MDSPVGYIATVAVGAVGTYVSQLLRPKIKIHYWLPHGFIYKIPNQLNPTSRAPALPPAPGSAIASALSAATTADNFFLLTQSVGIQNFGRESAKWIEIVHAQKPDFFQLHPALQYTESIGPSGEHILRVESLAPKEFFTIQVLCHSHQPNLWFIRSEAGHASLMPWMTMRKYPRWARASFGLMTGIGILFTSYWVVKGVVFVLKSVGAL